MFRRSVDLRASLELIDGEALPGFFFTSKGIAAAAGNIINAAKVPGCATRRRRTNLIYVFNFVTSQPGSNPTKCAALHARSPEKLRGR